MKAPRLLLASALRRPPALPSERPGLTLLSLLSISSTCDLADRVHGSTPSSGLICSFFFFGVDFFFVITSEMHVMLFFRAYCRHTQRRRRRRSGVKDIRHHLVARTFSMSWTCGEPLRSTCTRCRAVRPHRTEFDHVRRTMVPPVGLHAGTEEESNDGLMDRRRE